MPFHAEIRQRRDIARGFNLTEEEVRTRFLAPLQAGELFMLEGKEWEPRKTKLTVVEGPELKTGQLGLGQGWTNAQKRGTDVTERFVNPGPAAAAAVTSEAAARLKERIVGRIGAGPLSLPDTLSLSSDLLPGARVSERLSAAEIAVWELLHAGTIELHAQAGSAPLGADQWEATLLEPGTWLPGVTDAPVISASA